MNDSIENEVILLESDNELSGIKSFSNTHSETKAFISRKRKSWTDSESMWLVIGTLIHGKGAWCEILTQFENRFNHRSTIQLKDRYRNILKNNVYKVLEKAALQTINELKIVKY